MSLVQAHSSGRDAAINIASLSRTMLGSSECVKCVVQDDKEIFVTSAAVLLQNLEIKHPIGQYVVSACQSFHQQHGTAVKTLLFLIGGLTRAADSLLEKGVPKTAVINGMEEAINLCCQKMTEMSIPVVEIIKQQQTEVLSDTELSPFTSATLERNLESGKEKKTKEVQPHNRHEIPAPKSQLKHYGECSLTEVLSSDRIKERPLLSNENYVSNQEIHKNTSRSVNSKKEVLGNSKEVFNMDLSCFAETEVVILKMKMAEPDTERTISDFEDVEWFFEDDNLEQISVMSNSPQLEQMLSDNEGQMKRSTPSVEATSSCARKGETLECCHSNTDEGSQNKKHVDDSPLQMQSGSCQYNQENSDSEFDDCFEASSQENTAVVGKRALKDNDDDDDFAVCFESEFNMKGQSLRQGTEQTTSANEDISETVSCKENVPCVSLPKKENSGKTIDFIGLENLLKTKGIQVGKKKLTSATNIMNNSRHFKTADLPVQVLIGQTTESGVQSQTDVTQVRNVNRHLPVRDSLVDRKGDTDVVSDIKSKYTKTAHSVEHTGHKACRKSDPAPAGHDDHDFLSNFQSNPEQEELQLQINVNKNVSKEPDECEAASQSPSSLLQKLDSLQRKMQISREKTIKAGLLHSRHFMENSDPADRHLQFNESIENVDQSSHYTLPNPLLHTKALEVGEDNSVNIPSESARSELSEEHSKWSWLRYLGRGLSHGAEGIMDVVTQAVINQASLDHSDKNNFTENIRLDVTRLHCCSMPGPICNTAKLVQGVVLAISNHVMPLIHRNQGRQLSTLMINADVTKNFRHIGYKRPTNVTKISTADRFVKSDDGESWLSEVLHTLQEFSIKVIMARGSIADDVKVVCEAHDIIAMENIPYTAMLAMCSVTQTVMAAYLLDCCQDNICNSVEVSLYQETWMDCYGNSSYVKVTCGKMPIQTCVISHPSSGVRDIEEQKFWRCANCMSSALRTGKVLYGVGQTEKQCGQYLMEQADLMTKRYSSQSDWINEKVYYPVIYEEVCLVLEDFYDTVIKNACVLTASTHNKPSTSNMHFSPNTMRTDFTSGNNRHDYCADDTSLKLVNSLSPQLTADVTSDNNSIRTMSSTSSQSCKGLDGVNNLSEITTGHGDTLIVDDLESKMAAFKTAFQTIRTILLCDTYIITGQYGVKTSDQLLDKILGSHVIL